MKNFKLIKTFFIVSLNSVLLFGQNGKWLDEFSVNAFASTSYSFNFNKPSSGLNKFRVFDFTDNSIKLDVAEVVIQKQVTNPGDAGFRIDLTTGSSLPYLTNSNLNPHEIDFQQAFISYTVKLGSGMRIDAGKFVTPLGYELIEGYDGYNDNSSRSLLFGYAIPFTHTGLKVSYPFSNNFSALLMLVNGWDNSTDNNKSKTAGAQISYSPSENIALFGNLIYGPEQSNNNSLNRIVYDLSGMMKLNEVFSLGLNIDYGIEQKSNAAGEDAKWLGVAGYLSIKVIDCLRFCLRGETFNDQDGLRTGIVQRISEFTFTPEYKVNSNFIVRGDLRMDKSNKLVFDKEGKLKDSQVTASLNLLFVL